MRDKRRDIPRSGLFVRSTSGKTGDRGECKMQQKVATGYYDDVTILFNLPINPPSLDRSRSTNPTQEKSVQNVSGSNPASTSCSAVRNANMMTSGTVGPAPISRAPTIVSIHRRQPPHASRTTTDSVWADVSSGSRTLASWRTICRVIGQSSAL